MEYCNLPTYFASLTVVLRIGSLLIGSLTMIRSQNPPKKAPSQPPREPAA
jgi:hypothetical protein